MSRDKDGRLRLDPQMGEYRCLITDRGMGAFGMVFEPDGFVWYYAPGTWAAPSARLTPDQAREVGEAFIRAANEVARGIREAIG